MSHETDSEADRHISDEDLGIGLPKLCLNVSDVEAYWDETKRPEINYQTDSIVIETDQPGLVLVQMMGPDDDERILDFQNQNLDHIAEFGNTIFKSIEEVTENRLEMGGQRFWIRRDGTDVGWESYWPSDEDAHNAKLGIIIAKAASGNGYATSAIKALTKYIKPNFEEIVAEARSDHGASIAVFEKSGYRRDKKKVQRDWAGETGAVVLKHIK